MRRIGTVLCVSVFLCIFGTMNLAEAFTQRPQLPSSKQFSDTLQGPVALSVTEDTTARTLHTKRWITDNPDSKKSLNQTSSYTEIRPGLHVLTSGSHYQDADPTLTPTPNGAQSKQLTHPVRFQNQLSYGRPAVEQGDKTNPVLEASPALIVYRDLSTDRSVVLARSQPASLTFEKNVATYKDAFDHLRADVRYTVRTGNLEQDVLLYEKPLKPSAYGLNDETTVLAVMTRVFSLEDRMQSGTSLQSPSTRTTLAQSTIDLKTLMTPRIAGAIVLEQDGQPIQQFARSYVLSKNSKQAVHKRLVTVQGIHFLAEEIPAAYFQEQDLPVAQGPALAQHTPFTQLEVLANTNFTSEERLAEVRLTLISAPVIIDFISVMGTIATDFTFEQGETYLVMGPVTMTGITTFEGGATIKFDSTGFLDVSDPVFNTTSSNWAVFTSKDDNSVGEVIGTGSPINYPNALTLAKGSARYVQIRYADEGIVFSGGDTLNVRDSEFFAVGTPVNASSSAGPATVNLNNLLIVHGTNGPVLADDSTNALMATANNITIAHLTGDGFSNTSTAAGSSLSVTDSLFVDIQGSSVFAGTAPTTENYNAFYQTPGTGSGGNNVALGADPILTDWFLDQASLVIDAGSSSAFNTGLYHYTTDPAGTIEANSQTDIGYHFPPDLLDYSMLALDSLIIQQQTTVHSGKFGVNEPAPGTSPVLQLIQQSQTEADVSILGDRVFIENQAVVQGDVFYNHLTGTGTINGSQTTPLALPLFDKLPVLKPAVLQGTEADVLVPDLQQQVLAPGKYGTVTVSYQATLELTGGLYEIESLVVVQQARVHFTGPAELRIQKNLDVSQEVYFGPASGSDLSASDIRVSVEGSGVVGHHVNIGQTGIFFGHVLAPNGAFRLDQQNQLFGHVIAKDIIIEQQNTVDLQVDQGVNTVAAPLIMPPGGSFFDSVTVDIFTITSGATVHFTTDGSTPTTLSDTFDGPITLTTSPTPITVKAIAVRPGFTDSAVTSAEFTVQAQPVAQVAISPASGTFQDFVFITMSTETEGAQIFYTTDGSDPTEESIPYQFAFSLNQSATVKAVAIKAGFVNSPIVGETYTIQSSPAGTHQVIGRLLDTNSLINGGVEIPVVGATVSLLNTTVSAVSGADGNFILNNVPFGEQILDINTSTANLAPDGSTYAGFREMISIFPGVTVVDRPFFLPRIDASSLTTIDPLVDTLVVNPNIGASLLVQAGTALDEFGQPFTGQLSISEVPAALAPAALPESLEPGLLVTIQPVGVTFSTPAPLTLPNVDQFSVNAQNEYDIWSLDPASGTFMVVGMAQVSADGSSLETVSGGIIAADWHMTGPPSSSNDNSSSSGSNNNPGKQQNCNCGSDNSIKSGELVVSHDLVSYRSFGQSRSLQMIYRTLSADPRPIVSADATNSVRNTVPLTVSTTLELNGESQGDEVFINTAFFSESANEDFRVARQLDATELPTGRYPYRMKITNNYLRTSVSGFSVGNVLVNNEQASPYGAGWTLAGVQRLHIQPGGSALITNGTGGSQFFEVGAFYSNDFEGAVGPEWSNSTSTSVTPSGRGFLGEFGNQTATLTLNNLPDHDSVTVSLDFYALKSLDGNNTTFGPDRIFIKADTFITLLDTTFSNAGHPQAYPESFGVGNFPSRAGADESNTLGYTFFGDTVYNLEFTLNHISDSLTLDFIASGLQGLGDESWGIDNVAIGLDGPAINNSVNFQSPPGDFSQLEQNTDGTFTRTMKDGTKHHFDANGFHTSIVDRNGNTTRYIYDPAGLLMKVVDATENLPDPACPAVGVPAQGVTCLFYTAGKLSSIIDPAGRETKFEIDANGDLIKITDPDDSFRLFAYDSRHLIQSQTKKRGFPVTYDYDFAGRNIRGNLPDGSKLEFTPSDTFGLVDLTTGLGTATNPAPFVRPQLATATVKDGNGNETTSTLDSFGSNTGSTDALGRSTDIQRDADGNPIQITQPNGAVTVNTFDARGNLLTSSTKPNAGSPVADEVKTTTTYDPVFNNVTSTIDPENNLTTINYNANGNPIEVIDAQLTKSILEYNDLNCPGKATKFIQAQGLSKETTRTIQYDSVTCNLIKTIDHLTHEKFFEYDSTGNLIKITDAKLRITRFEYDSMNRLTKSIDSTNPAPSPACGAAGVTCFTYDEEGNRKTLTDANGNGTAWDYDELGRTIKRTNPLGNFQTFQYDGNGNLRFTTDRKGQVVEFQYDVANQLKKRILLPGNTNEEVADFDYDSMGNLKLANDPDSSLTAVYDFLNRIKEVSTTGSLSQPEITLKYTYDKNGNRKTLDDGVNPALSNYTYNSLKQLDTLTTPDLQVFDLDYDALGLRKLMTYPNGIVTDYGYDGLGQLLSLVHTLPTDPVDPARSSFTYTYDPVGSRDTLNTVRSNVAVAQTNLAFHYDDLNRLDIATRPLVGDPDETFQYDPVGNRELRDGQAFTAVHNAANQLSEDEDFSYTYDLNGNMTRKESKDTTEITDFIWNAQNQLIKIEEKPDAVSAPSQTVEFKYDALGRRIQKIMDGTVTAKYVYSGEDILHEFDGANIRLASYIYGSGIDEPLRMKRRGVDYFFIADGQGSVTELMDFTGNIVQSYMYDSFGNIQTFDQNGAMISIENGIVNPFAYTGREFDIETGLYFYRARYYDPKAGRFISEDPIGFAGGDVNLYGYVLNDPLNFVDPNGLCPTCKKKGDCEKFLAACESGTVGTIPIFMACEAGCVAAGVGAPACAVACAIIETGTVMEIIIKCRRAFKQCKKNECPSGSTGPPQGGGPSAREKMERNRGFINRDELGLKPGQIQGPGVLNP